MFDEDVSGVSKWNYSDDEAADYKQSISGTVVEIQRKPKTEYGGTNVKYFKDGRPQYWIVWIIKEDDGEEYPWYINDKWNATDMSRCSLAMLAIEKCLEAREIEPPSRKNHWWDYFKGAHVTITAKDLKTRKSVDAKGKTTTYSERNWGVVYNGIGMHPWRGERDFVKELEPAKPESTEEIKASIDEALDNMENTQLRDTIRSARSAAAAVYAEEDMPF